MNVVGHFVGQSGVNHALTLNAILTLKRTCNHNHGKVTFTLWACARMTGVFVAVVDNLKVCGAQGGSELGFNGIANAHGVILIKKLGSEQVSHLDKGSRGNTVALAMSVRILQESIENPIVKPWSVEHKKPGKLEKRV